MAQYLGLFAQPTIVCHLPLKIRWQAAFPFTEGLPRGREQAKALLSERLELLERSLQTFVCLT
jgi:hypothetical protein